MNHQPTTLIFVHGTGVRQPDYDQTYKQVQDEIQRQTDLTVLPCYWGHLGSRLNASGTSVPDYDSTRHISKDEVLSDKDYLISLWEVLYQDPLYELRLLSLHASESAELPPGQRPPGELLKKALNELPPIAEMDDQWSHLQAKLKRGNIDTYFDQARQDILNATPFRQALDTAPKELNEYRAAAARAIVAQAIFMSEQENQLPLIATHADLRDEVVELLATTLGDSTRGMVGDWMKYTLGGLLAHIGSYYGKHHRGTLTDQTSNIVGDILFYQARGEITRTFIHQTIQATPGPVILLAHSLGGIMCVDLLIRENIPQVKLLITVGSQSPYFYEINALQSLPFKNIPANERLPSHFPAWLNLYDRRDFLSYIGAGIFGSKVTDFEVDNRQPFPNSHGAYWNNSVVWERIIKKIQLL